MEKPKEKTKLRIVHRNIIVETQPPDIQLEEVCKYCHKILFGPCDSGEEAKGCVNYNRPTAAVKRRNVIPVKKKGKNDGK